MKLEGITNASSSKWLSVCLKSQQSQNPSRFGHFHE
jgi:hypothetical protein